MSKIENAIAITLAQAKAEIARRLLVKGDAARLIYPPKHVMQATGNELAALAGVKPVAKSAKAPAVKVIPVVTVVDPKIAKAQKLAKAHVELRKLAKAISTDAYKAGMDMTYAEACYAAGTAPFSVTKGMSYSAQVKAFPAAAKLAA
jgi:hypothetical protein